MLLLIFFQQGSNMQSWAVSWPSLCVTLMCDANIIAKEFAWVCHEWPWRDHECDFNILKSCWSFWNILDELQSTPKVNLVVPPTSTGTTHPSKVSVEPGLHAACPEVLPQSPSNCSNDRTWSNYIELLFF
jgi:hypothetical protein